MKSWWKCVGACVFGLSMACQASAAEERGLMSREDASAMAAQIVQAVETMALPPIDPDVQAQAKQALFRVVQSGSGSGVDRATVYAAVRLYLLTVDSDGHTQLWSGQHATAFSGSTHAEDASRADVARVVRVADRDVLVVRPPQTTYVDATSAHDYAARLSASVDAALAHAKACALVVDLGDQKGGNAWPAISVLGALVTPANRARQEDRFGHRAEVVSSENYRHYRDYYGPLPASPLAAFAGIAFGVVTEPETASAGEMVAMMLTGEPEVRSFGRHTFGMTTVNFTVELPDGAMALVSDARYEMDGQAVVRGPLQPDFPADYAETPEQSIQRAAAWAAAHSSLCRAR